MSRNYETILKLVKYDCPYNKTLTEGSLLWHNNEWYIRYVKLEDDKYVVDNKKVHLEDVKFISPPNETDVMLMYSDNVRLHTELDVKQRTLNSIMEEVKALKAELDLMIKMKNGMR